MTKKLNVKYWDVQDVKSFEYPEVNDPGLSYEPIAERLKNHNCGIAFSGGGTVSAALAPGFIKGIEDLGLMDNVSYISGVSGGTWGTAAYCYALDAERRKNYLSGVIENPIGLTWEQASDNPTPGSMVAATTNAKITLIGIEEAYRTKGAYTDTVGEIFLAPFGLHGKQYFTSDEKAINDILSRNPDLKNVPFVSLYQKPVHDADPAAGSTSPYYIMNGSMFTPSILNFTRKHETYPFEFTPLYSGMKGTQPSTNKEVIGGAYVESYGFNSKNPKLVSTDEKTNTGIVSVDQRREVFDLNCPVGTSGSAIEQIVSKWAPFILNPLLWLLPRYDYWNPKSDKLGDTHEFLYGDGGITENTGISPLLRRGVKNIVLFITEPLDVKPLTDRYFERGQRMFGHNQFAGLFGADKVKYDKYTQTYYNVNNDDCPYIFFKKDEFATIQSELQAAKDKGGPITVTKSLAVQDNPRFGIVGGWNANVTFVVMDTCLKFNASLDKSLYVPDEDSTGLITGGHFTHEEINNFPAICTFFQNAKGTSLKDLAEAPLIQLTNAQANLLACQAYWTVQNSKVIQDALKASA